MRVAQVQVLEVGQIGEGGRDLLQLVVVWGEHGQGNKLRRLKRLAEKAFLLDINASRSLITVVSARRYATRTLSPVRSQRAVDP